MEHFIKCCLWRHIEFLSEKHITLLFRQRKKSLSFKKDLSDLADGLSSDAVLRDDTGDDRGDES